MTIGHPTIQTHLTEMQSSSIPDDKTGDCILCFSKIKDRRAYTNNFHNLYKMCSKYLHSAITKETAWTDVSRGHYAISFCQLCFQSAVELNDHAGKLEFFQKSVSEYILMFSLGILHRRGATDQMSPNSVKKIIGCDVSTLPKCNSWKSAESAAAPCSTVSVTESQNIAFNDNFVYESCDPLQIPGLTGQEELTVTNNVRADEVKVEINPNDWTNENVGTDHENCAENPPQLENFEIEGDFPLQTEGVSNLHSPSAESGASLKPFVKIKRLQLQSTGRYSFREKRVPKNIGPGNRSDSAKKAKGKGFSKRVPGMEELHGIIQLPPKTRGEDRADPNVPAIQSSTFIDVNYMSPESPFKWQQEPYSQLDLNSLLNPQQPSVLSRLRNREDVFKMGPERKQQQMKSKEVTQANSKQTAAATCALCSKTFSSVNYMQIHIRMVHRKEKPYKCRVCNKKFALGQHLKSHIKTHTGEKPYKCDQCDHSCSQAHHLKTHKNHMHSETRNFECIRCGKHFKTKDAVRQHYKNTHTTLEFSNDCIIGGNDNE